MILEILFIIFMIFYLFSFFPGGPVATYPWAPNLLLGLCVVILGLYLWVPGLR